MNCTYDLSVVLKKLGRIGKYSERSEYLAFPCVWNRGNQFSSGSKLKNCRGEYFLPKSKLFRDALENFQNFSEILISKLL